MKKRFIRGSFSQTILSFVFGIFSWVFLGRKMSIGLTHLQHRYRKKSGMFSFGTKQKNANQKQNMAKLNPRRGYLKNLKKGEIFQNIYYYGKVVEN